MKLYTCQMAKYLVAENFLDITVKSGDKVFAPTWEMVDAHKKGHITDEEYTEQYKSMMRTSFNLNRKRWLEVANQEVLTIGCYCKVGAFCPRYLLVEYLRKICRHFNIPFEYLGELT